MIYLTCAGFSSRAGRIHTGARCRSGAPPAGLGRPVSSECEVSARETRVYLEKIFSKLVIRYDCFPGCRRSSRRRAERVLRSTARRRRFRTQPGRQPCRLGMPRPEPKRSRRSARRPRYVPAHTGVAQPASRSAPRAQPRLNFSICFARQGLDTLWRPPSDRGEPPALWVPDHPPRGEGYGLENRGARRVVGLRLE